MVVNMTVDISVVIIAKNEESRIEAAIKSVLWAKEIIVVDDFSTDATVEKCKQFSTVKVLQRKMDIEGRHRNWANSMASCEWVLSLDADERAEASLEDEIAGLLKTKIEYNGFTIPRKNYIGNYWIRYGGWYPSAQLKFFRKNMLLWEEVEVHPRAFMEGPRGQIKSALVHLTYRDFSDALLKMDRQTTLEAKKWVKDKRSVSLGRCVRKMLDRFFRAYILKKGYKDGYVGFVMAVFGGLYQVLSFAKCKSYSETVNDVERT